MFTSSTTLISEMIHFESPHSAIVPDFEVDINNCCEQYQKKLNKTPIEFIPIPPVSLNKESLNIASQKLNQIDDSIDKISTESVFSKVASNSYFSYIFLSIIKIVLVYIFYKIFRKCLDKYRQPNHKNLSNACYDGMINNCLTFNICKKTNKVHDVSVELPELDNISLKSSETEKKPDKAHALRRSLRISKLKDRE